MATDSDFEIHEYSAISGINPASPEKQDRWTIRADSRFYDDAIPIFLQGRHIDCIISAKLTHGLAPLPSGSYGGVLNVGWRWVN